MQESRRYSPHCFHDWILASAMKSYDPLTPPEPEEWLSMDEQARLDVVEDFHRRARISLPNARVHAVLHAIVENQIALGDEIPVHRTVQRLMLEGLDRHESIHAVGSVLLNHLSDLLSSPEVEPDVDSNAPYYAALDQLTAKDWLRSR